MNHFHAVDGTLFCEGVALETLADRHGTPLYVYSRAAIEEAFSAYQTALAGHDHLICYAVKANSNLAVLGLLAELGAGFDIVSIGELERVLAAGGDPGKVVFSGVCKNRADMLRALQAGIHCFNVESEAELETLAAVARENDLIAPVSLRVNPDVDARTHPYIATGLKDNKFGIAIDAALPLYHRAADLPGIRPIGLDCHIGSQILAIEPFAEALDHLVRLVDQLQDQGISLQHIDVGGGLGVSYQGETVPAVADYVAALTEPLAGHNLTLILEPGRSIVANGGVLLTRVEYLKPGRHKNFALVDAAMNDLLRPALYGAWQDIVAVAPSQAEATTWDIVGPVCETGDFLGHARELALTSGDILAVMGAGAYGFTMASNYNSRPRPAEILVDLDCSHVVRERESLQQLWAGEATLPGKPR